MKTAKNRLWYGVYGKEYTGDEPAFYNAEQFEWTKILTDNYKTILTELTPLMYESNADLKPYFDSEIQYPPKNWRTLGFYFWGKKINKTCQRFPNTDKILRKIPGLISATVNMIEPHTHIKPHFGDTNAVYRVHLGIKIPAGLPICGFKVKGEERAWEEGKLLVFLDANVHEAFNKSDERRYIMLLDIIRPEFASRKRQICVKVLSMLSLYYLLALIPKALTSTVYTHTQKTTRKWHIDLALLPIILLWYIALPVIKFTQTHFHR